MNLLKQLPNALTSLNLVTGILGIINCFIGDVHQTIYFILLAGVFDFTDGFAARLLSVGGEFGKELDSLADMVTFGVLPSIYLFQLSDAAAHAPWITYSTLLVSVFSAVRLAKFNLDTEQKFGFKGLPTPANAIMLTSISWIPAETITNQFFILAVVLLSSYLLVSHIGMIALKYKSFGFRGNEYRYVLLITVAGSFALLGIPVLPYIIPGYILLSVVSSLTTKTT